MGTFNSFINECKKENEISMTIGQMAIAMGVGYDTFKKHYLKTRVSKSVNRDFVIGLCGILGMNGDQTSKAICLYNEEWAPLAKFIMQSETVDFYNRISTPVSENDPKESFVEGDDSDDYIERKALENINDRDKLLYDQLNQKHSNCKQATINEINDSLRKYGFRQLQFFNTNRKKVDNLKYEIIKEGYVWSDRSSPYVDYSLIDGYDPENYIFNGKMIIQQKSTKKRFMLMYFATLDRYNVSELVLDKKGVYHYDSNNDFFSYNVKDYGDKEIFLNKIKYKTQINAKELRQIVDDTRNYRMRSGVVNIDGKLKFVVETFDYDYPLSNRYYQVIYFDNNYTYSVTKNSIFMQEIYYKKYERIYGRKKYELLYSTDSLTELKNTINKDINYYTKIDLSSYYHKIFVKLKKIIDNNIKEIKNNNYKLRDIKGIYDENIDEVCRYYDLKKEFNCVYDKNIYVAKKRKANVQVEDLPLVTITMDNLYEAFETGITSKYDLCKMISEHKGIIVSI